MMIKYYEKIRKRKKYCEKNKEQKRDYGGNQCINLSEEEKVKKREYGIYFSDDTREKLK